MEPILSKQEIADLLKSLQDVSVPESRQSPSSFSSPVTPHREVNLFDAPPAGDDYSPIDNFEIIINQFADCFSSSLSRYLQRSVSIDSIDCDTTPFKKYLLADEPRKATGIIDLSPLKFPGLVNYDANLCSILLEFMLGGSDIQAGYKSDRAQTRLELHILKSLMNLVCQTLDRSFKPIVAINCSLIKTMNDSELISFIDSETVVAVYSCEIRIDSLSGKMELIFPVKAFEPYRDSMRRLTLLTGLGDNRWSESITGNIDTMALTLMARTESIELSIKQLIDLKAGDIIPIDHEPGNDIDILVEGIVKFSGNMGHKNQKRNVRINRMIS